MLPTITCLWILIVVAEVRAQYRELAMHMTHDGFTIDDHKSINVSVRRPYMLVSVYGKYSLITCRNKLYKYGFCSIMNKAA